MSTYTDLKNRVRETITVGFRPEDRVTAQKVRFYNEENEYWGSFSGNLSGKINISGGTLSSVDIYGSTLIDPKIQTASSAVIDLGSMGDQLEELSGLVYEDLSGSVNQCVKGLQDISGMLSGVPVDTASALSAID